MAERRRRLAARRGAHRGGGDRRAARSPALTESPLAHLAAHGHHAGDNALFSRARARRRTADGLRHPAADLASRALVVLSACDVGRHDVRPGDESLGMATAFLAPARARWWPPSAGSPTTLPRLSWSRCTPLCSPAARPPRLWPPPRTTRGSCASGLVELAARVRLLYGAPIPVVMRQARSDAPQGPITTHGDLTLHRTRLRCQRDPTRLYLAPSPLPSTTQRRSGTPTTTDNTTEE